MKKVILKLLSFSLVVLSGCQTLPNHPSFEGKVIRVEETSVIIEPFEDEEIRQSGDEVSIPVDEDLVLEIGDEVKVTHEGPIMESYPLQIKLLEIEAID